MKKMFEFLLKTHALNCIYNINGMVLALSTLILRKDKVILIRVEKKKCITIETHYYIIRSKIIIFMYFYWVIN